MSPKYKLVYFDARGAAESIRYVFALADVPYEDVRVGKGSVTWPEFKPHTPFGQLPVLEIDGEMMCDSQAILRHLARVYGLAGKNELEQAKADMIMCCVGDSMKPLFQLFHEKDDARKAETTKKFQEEQLPQYLSNFENLVTANKSGSGYFVGNSMTVADVYFYSMFGFYKMAQPDLTCEKYPKLKALLEKVGSNSKIKEWEAKRPQTDR